MSPPPPPPPPPPMPNFDLKASREKRPHDGHHRGVNCYSQSQETGQLAPPEFSIDLVSPNGHIKPNMKMRTLNWRRIPKRRILSHQLERSFATQEEENDDDDNSNCQIFRGMKIKSEARDCKQYANIVNSTSKSICESSDDDSDGSTNIWFKIAKTNNTIKRVEQKAPKSSAQKTPGSTQNLDTSQETITNSDNKRSLAANSEPISSARKSARDVKEILESARRRMDSLAARLQAYCSSNGATPTNGTSNLFQAYNLEINSCSKLAGNITKSPLNLNSIQSTKPKSVLEAIDFNNLENLFCLNNQPCSLLDDDSSPSSFMRRSSWRTNASSDSVISSSNNSYLFDQQNHPDNDSYNYGEDDEACNEDFLEDAENILDSKKSLNVNIFLKQLKNQNELIEQINGGNNKLIGEEKLQNILKLLPDESEQVQLMKFYKRNKQHRLPVAEKFLLQLLIRVPNLRIKIKFMLLKEKYYNDISEHIPSELNKIDGAIRELRKSQKFRDLLNLVLVTGNFLNSGGYAADAVGFSLDCLNRLHEVRSNREGLYLIHYIAEVAQKMQLIDFQADELSHLESASRVCLESIKLDLVSMTERINELKCDIDKTSSEDKKVSLGTNGAKGAESLTKTQQSDGSDLFISDLLRTLDDVKCNVDFLKSRVTSDLEAKRKKLADYLCEDPATFNLHDCFSSIQAFSQRLKAATEENERRVRLEARKSSLKRSNTINPRMPKVATNTGGRRVLGGRKSLGGSGAQRQPSDTLEPAYFDQTRASFGGYISSERRQSFNRQQHATIPRSIAPASELVRTSSTCSSAVKSSLSSLSSQATSSVGSDYDDLHEGLMKLLNDTNGRRSSGQYRRASGRFGIGQ